jgi:hypothetical protein
MLPRAFEPLPSSRGETNFLSDLIKANLLDNDLKSNRRQTECRVSFFSKSDSGILKLSEINPANSGNDSPITLVIGPAPARRRLCF